MSRTINHKQIAALGLPRAIGALISVLRTIILALTGNKAFPNPQPPLPVLVAALAALEAAEATANARTRGAADARDQRRAEVVTLFLQLKAYVQSVADADPANAAALIQSAGLTVRRSATRAPRVFAVRQGSSSGAVTLVTASVGPRASYEWELSADGGKTWQPLPPTLQARTTVTGLGAAATYSFRQRAVIKSGAADWSQPLSIIVK